VPRKRPYSGPALSSCLSPAHRDFGDVDPLQSTDRLLSAFALCRRRSGCRAASRLPYASRCRRCWSSPSCRYATDARVMGNGTRHPFTIPMNRVIAYCPVPVGQMIPIPFAVPAAMMPVQMTPEPAAAPSGLADRRADRAVACVPSKPVRSAGLPRHTSPRSTLR
jgi:hypothetical protein